MKVVAFHGDFASPQMLREDSGDPSWITDYMGWEDIHPRFISSALDQEKEPYVLLGYSRGGQVACRVANSIVYRELFRGIVLYEAPLPPEGLVGNHHVLYLRSTYRSWLPWREWRKDRIIRYLKEHHKVAVLGSECRHLKRVNGEFRHGWDTQTNPHINKWIQGLS